MLIGLVVAALGSEPVDTDGDLMMAHLSQLHTGQSKHERLIPLGVKIKRRHLKLRTYFLTTEVLEPDTLPLVALPTMTPQPPIAGLLQEHLQSTSGCDTTVDEALAASLRSLRGPSIEVTVAVSDDGRPAFWFFRGDNRLHRDGCTEPPVRTTVVPVP